MWKSVKVSNVFNTLTLKQIFWKTKTFFKKLEYRFLVESTKIENASFTYKNAMSEANVKTNSIVSAKWTYHKEPVTASFFWKFYSSLRTSYKDLFWCTNDPNFHIHTFRKRWSFIWGLFFPVSILKGRINVLQINLGMKLINQSLRHVIHTQQTFVFSKSTTETLKKGMKYVQCQQ